jgi:hypothetical protein
MSFRINNTGKAEEPKAKQPEKPEKFYTKEEIDLIGTKYENPQEVPLVLYKKRLTSDSQPITSQNIIYDKTTKTWKFSS